MVYDCFQFFNELDILKLRMHVLSDIVDYFVVSEATETFSGLKKPLYFLENREMFKEFEGRIIHQVIDDTPAGGTHERDTFQKNAVTRGLKNCTADDIIIYSDLDEIPNPEEIKKILDAGINRTKVYHFAQRLFYGYLNMEEVSGKLLSYAGDFDDASPKKWIGTRMLSYELLQKRGWQLGELRFPERKAEGIRIDNGGWHFGYMGGKGESDLQKRVTEKVVSAAHQELNNRRTLAKVRDNLLDGTDMFGRDAKLVMCEIDETFPAYLRAHLAEYDYLILRPESKGRRMLRHLRAGMIDTFYRAGRGVKRVLRKLKGGSHGV